MLKWLRRRIASPKPFQTGSLEPPIAHPQIRINELARELDVKARTILECLPRLGVGERKTHSSSIDVAVAEKVREHFLGMEGAQAEAVQEAAVAHIAKEAAAKASAPGPHAVGAISPAPASPPSVPSISVAAGPTPPAAAGSSAAISPAVLTPPAGDKSYKPRKTSQANRIKQIRNEFRHFLPNLEFHDDALERYDSLEEHERTLAAEQLKQLDSRNDTDQHMVPQTKPKLFQRQAGRNLRIYFRKADSANRYFVRLIGTKNTQNSDYRKMRS